VGPNELNRPAGAAVSAASSWDSAAAGHANPASASGDAASCLPDPGDGPGNWAAAWIDLGGEG